MSKKPMVPHFSLANRVSGRQLIGRANRREEGSEKKGSIKRFSENAGLVGLVLGLILSTSTLYDVFIRKPEADRISAISQFNQTVNSAAKTRQDLIQSSQNADAQSKMAMQAMATPRILNDISTAKALLSELRDKDVGIPQLLILVSESLTAGDAASAETFVMRALSKRDVTPYLASEARRYNGKYLFFIGKPKEAREMFLLANQTLGEGMAVQAAKAFNLADLIATQYALGYCLTLDSDIDAFKRVLNAQGVSADARIQLTSTVVAQLNQYAGQKCERPANLDALMVAK